MTRRGDDAVTLIELIITIAIIGVIVAPLGLAIVTGMRVSSDADLRIGEANDGRVLAATVVPDVQSASTISTALSGCGGAGTRLLVQQRGVTSGALENRAAYVVVTGPTSSQLIRRACSGTSVTAEQVVVRDLPSASALTVSCSPRLPFGADVTVTVQHPTSGTTTVSATTRTSDGVCA